MGARRRISLRLVTAVLSAVALLAVQSGSEGSIPVFRVTEEDQAVVREVLAQEEQEEQIISQLIQLLVHEQWGVRETAAEELKRRELAEHHLRRLEAIVWALPASAFSNTPMQPNIRPGDPIAAQQPWDVLEHARTDGKPLEEQIEWYVKHMRGDGPSGSSRGAAAARGLIRIGEPAVPRLIRALKREGTPAQLKSVWALRDIGTQDAFDAVERWALVTLEGTDDPRILSAAISALRSIRSTEAFEPLERMLWEHLETGQASGIIHALSDIDPERAREPLSRILAEYPRDPEGPWRHSPYVTAALSLARLGHESGWLALEDALDSPVYNVRRQLAFALSATGDARARPLLMRLAEDEDEQIASLAASQLRNLERTLQD